MKEAKNVEYMPKAKVQTCAYCGSENTKVTGWDKRPHRYIEFSVKCEDCERTDLPTMLESDLLKLLMYC